MNIMQAFNMAWESIRSNKMRSFLTMLGMIIGVASVITLVSLMQGAISFSTDQFVDMGSNQITITITPQSQGVYLKEQELKEFANKYSNLFNSMSPQVTGTFTVRTSEEKQENKSITGVNENFLSISRHKMKKGRFINYTDTINRSKVCVIGSYIEKAYFNGNAIGQKIKLGTDSYEVVGILKEKYDSTKDSTDDCLYAPYTTLAKALFQGRINTYILDSPNEETVKQGKLKIEDFLFRKFHDDDNYQIFSLGEMLEMMEESTTMMQNILVGIAGISLLVAGIGIMNIMLVSVTERTREIGIRKSLGARKKDIMRQFVLEAGLLSTLGGVLGIILGGTATAKLGSLIGINATPSLGAVLMASGISAGIGILFGYLPANKAAKLNPIDALRNE